MGRGSFLIREGKVNSFAGPFSLVSSPKRCGSIRDHEARVLIIHGQPEVRKVLVDELTSSGCRTFEAMSRADGLPLFHQVKPDLILLEGRPDRKDDLETISRIRRFAEIPVIVLVDHGSEFDGQSPRVENVTFFAPPFRIKEVVAEAKRLCESQENPILWVHRKRGQRSFSPCDQSCADTGN